MRISAFWGPVAICLVVLGISGCSRELTDSEYELILNWLECDNCSDGEREAVRALGSEAIPALVMVLEEVPEPITAATRRELENTWSPEISDDREQFIEGYLKVVQVLAQTRAAMSLGDLGAARELRESLDEAEARGYGDGLIRVLQGAYQRAENGGPVVAVVRLLPNPVSLPLGSSGAFAVSVEDDFGNPLEVSLAWSSSDSSIVQVDATGGLTPVTEGFATISAVAGGVSGEATVGVVPAKATLPRIVIVSGDHQQGLHSSVLSQPVRVRVLDEAAIGVSGVYLEWQVLQGGGSVQPATGITGPSGEISAQWTLGARTEPQRLEARLPNSNAVVFRATVIPGTAQTIAVVPPSATVAVGRLVELEVLSVDAEGNEWAPNLVSWTPADSTIASVTDAGVVVGVSPGETQVTAVVAGLSRSADILVVSPFEPLAGATAVVGHLFVDEGSPDGVRDAGEPPLNLAGVQVRLTNPPINSFVRTTFTNQDGGFVFEPLPPGNLTLELDTLSPRIPDAVRLRGAAEKVLTVFVGRVDTTDFSFGIEQQTVTTRTSLQTGSPAESPRPAEGLIIDLYPTRAAAGAQDPAQRLSRDTSDAMGIAAARFPRALNTDESGMGTDNRVFAVPSSVADLYVEVVDDSVRVIEYLPADSLFFAPDTVRARAGKTVLGVKVGTAGGPLEGWTVDLLSDSAGTADFQAASDANGFAFFPAEVPFSALPDTFYLRVASAPPGPALPPFEQVPLGIQGEAAGRHLLYSFDGSAGPSDTVDLGALRVRFLNSDLVVRMHHEVDDSASGQTFTGGDDFERVGEARITLWELTPSLDAIGTLNPDPVTGQVTFSAVATDRFYAVSAGFSVGWGEVVSDTLLFLDGTVNARPNGAAPLVEICPLGDPIHGCSSFAYELWGGGITGTVTAGGSPQIGITVTLTGGPDAISNTYITTLGGGFSATNLRAGNYTVAISNIPPWVTFPYTSQDVAIGADETLVVDFTGSMVPASCISGEVTLDGLGVAGVTINLLGGGAFTTETGAGGAYAFCGLAAGSYTVGVVPPAGTTFPVTSQVVTVGPGGVPNVDFAGVSLAASSEPETKTPGTGPPGVREGQD